MIHLPGFKPYVPDGAVEKARDAQLLRMAHPPFHQLRTFDDGSSRCSFDGCTKIYDPPQITTAVSAATESGGAVFAVLNVYAKLPAAGPFATVEEARDVKNALRKSGGHTYTVAGPFDPDTWYEQASNVIPPGARACAWTQAAVATPLEHVLA